MNCTDEAPPSVGFTCGDCPAGRSGDGVVCSDTNGCAGVACFAGVTCHDVAAPGEGYTCGACPSGYSGDGENCADIDDCAATPCGANGTCSDAGPNTYNCTCDSHYMFANGTCEVIDSCSTGEDDCVAAAICNHDGPGQHSCTCSGAGFSGDGTSSGSGCTDTDGCAAEPCFAGVACTDVAAPGVGRSCGSCPTGYSGDGATCVDVDACAATPCFAGVVCTDQAAPGTGFDCGDCPAEFPVGDGVTCEALPQGRVFTFGRNTYGTLGLGDNTDRNTPTEVTALGSTNQQVASGGGQSAVITQ